jgi:hypothetical protein
MSTFGIDLVKVRGVEKSPKYTWWKSTKIQGNGEYCYKTT